MKEKIKAAFKKIFFPPIFVVLIVSAIAFPSCVIVLNTPDVIPPVEYFVYFLSAYALTVFIIGFKRIAAAVRGFVLSTKLYERLDNNKFTRTFIHDMSFRGTVSMYQGLAVNTVFAVFKLVTAFYYRSVWFGAVGVYYLVMGFIRLTLVHGMKRAEKLQNGDELICEYKSYRLCGILMFLLNSGMAGMAVQMVHDNKYYEYPGLVIYLSAAYAFYTLTIAVINLFKFKRLNSPVLSASKALNFAGALMSIFALQTALIARFGGNDALFRQIANSLTGGAVCFATFGIAVFMIINSCVKLKKL